MNRKAAPKRQHVKMAAVESSSIKAIGHHAKSKTLRIEFHSGGVYDYPDTTAEEHQALIGAKSIGQHFHRMLRSRAFVKHDKAA